MSCEISSLELQLLSQLGSRRGVHRSPSKAPCLIGQMSHQFCRSSLSLFSFRVTCRDPHDCCSPRLAVSVELCDRFMAQDERVHHLTMQRRNMADGWCETHRRRPKLPRIDTREEWRSRLWMWRTCTHTAKIKCWRPGHVVAETRDRQRAVMHEEWYNDTSIKVCMAFL